MKLVEVKFQHFGQHSEADGVKALLIADSIEQAVDYIDKAYLSNALSSDLITDPEEERNFWVRDEWFEENPSKLDELANFPKLRYVKDTLSDVVGPASQLTRWLASTMWQDPDECTYGVDQYDWNTQRDITEAEVSVLLKLCSHAIDLRSTSDQGETA